MYKLESRAVIFCYAGKEVKGYAIKLTYPNGRGPTFFGQTLEELVPDLTRSLVFDELDPKMLLLIETYQSIWSKIPLPFTMECG